MTNEIKQRIEQINNGEVPEGYTHKYHIKPDLWMDEPLDAFFYKVKEKNSEKKYNTVFTNSATNGVIPQSQYFEKDIANEENIDGYYIVRAGDYIYNPRISEKAPYGPINQNLTGCTGIASPLYTVFSKKENVCICDDYIRYYLDSAEWNKYIYSVANYGARFDRMNISDSDFMNMPIALPLFAEQQKIAEILMQCDKLIELYQNETDELQKLKKICFCKMFPKSGNDVPEWRFPQFTDAWEQRKLDELVDVCSGRDYKHLSEGTIPVYGTGGYMLSVNEALSYDKDAIGIGRKGTIDKPYILKAPFWTVDTLFYAIPREKVDLNFAFDIFQNIDWKKKDESTGVPSLSKTAINNIYVLAPKFEEQQVLGRFFSRIDNLITLHQRKLAEMEKQKKSLTQLLLTGIVRV